MKFLPLDAALRLQKIQKILKEKDIAGLLAICGIDGGHNRGSKKLINYLLSGASGYELFHPTLANEKYEDLIMVIRQNGCSIYINPENMKDVTQITSQWPNTEYVQLPKHLLTKDADEAELFKIKTFIRFMNELPKKNIGIPYTIKKKRKTKRKRIRMDDGTLVDRPRTSDDEDDSIIKTANELQQTFEKMEIEKWPLVQSYGLVIFKQGFLTMTFETINVTPALESIYSTIDSRSIDYISKEPLMNFKKQWEASTAILERATQSIKDQKDFMQLSEEDIIEPLHTTYEYGTLNRRDTSATDTLYERCPRILPKPRCFMGTRTNLIINPNEPSSAMSNIQNQQPTHLVMEASTPLAPLAAARTLFLQNPSLPHDRLLPLKKEETHETMNLLLSLYEKLINCYEHMTTTCLIEHHDVIKDQLVTRVKQWCSTHCQEATFDVHINLIGMNNQGYTGCPTLLESSQDDLIDQLNTFGSAYLSIAFVNINDSLGTLCYGNTLIVTKHPLKSIFPPEVTIQTMDIPLISCFLGRQIEVERREQLVDALNVHALKKKFVHPTLQNLIHRFDAETMLMLRQAHSPLIQCELYVFEEGLILNHPAYGWFSLPFKKHLKIIRMFLFTATKDPHYLELSYEGRHPFGMAQATQTCPSIIIPLLPRTELRRVFRQDILPRWKQKIESFQYREVMDVEAQKDLQAMMVDYELLNVTRPPPTRFSFSLSQSNALPPLFSKRPNFELLLQKLQAFEKLNVADVDDISSTVVNNKHAALHILAGGVRTDLIAFAKQLSTLATSEYNWSVHVVNDLNEAIEPPFDFKAFFVQLAKALQSVGKTTNQHFIYLVPSFVDIERIVRAIHAFKKKKSLPVYIHSITALIHTHVLFDKENVLSTNSLSHVFRQCTNGFTQTIVLMNVLNKKMVEQTFQQAFPTATLLLLSSTKLHHYDLKIVLKASNFHDIRFARARALSSKSVGSETTPRTIKFPRLRFSLAALEAQLPHCFVEGTGIFYMTGTIFAWPSSHSTPTQENVTCLYRVNAFQSGHVELIRLHEEEVAKAIDTYSYNKLYVFGSYIEGDVIQAIKQRLSETLVALPSKRPLKLDITDLTNDERERIRDNTMLNDLPEGWVFDGSTFINGDGHTRHDHPQLFAYYKDYVHHYNEQAKHYNASLPDTNL